jgi:formylglycine-generating enzyme required for sulfatase activity
MVGVFLLAEGLFLDEASKALAAAGDSPSVGLYKERLNVALAAAAEAAAEKAWLSIQEDAKGKLDPAKAARLNKSLADFAKAYAETKLYKGLGEKVAALKTRIEDSLVFTEWPFDEKEAKRRQKVTADALGVKIEQDIEIAKGVKMTFVLIPAGEFLMGSPPTTTPEQLQRIFGENLEFHQQEFPQHRVKISKPFWLARTEVTQAEWEAVMGDNPSHFKGKPQNPVEHVTWHDCQGFVQKLSVKFKKPFRLPTEAEWEYACRAGAATDFYFGDSQAALPQHAWFNANSGGSTQPVGRTKPNAWGLHDMAGNVWEWCEDWYAPYDKAPQVDPKGPGAGSSRVLRGGSWSYGPGYCRAADRNMRQAEVPGQYYGCRVCAVATTLR